MIPMPPGASWLERAGKGFGDVEDPEQNEADRQHRQRRRERRNRERHARHLVDDDRAGVLGAAEKALGRWAAQVPTSVTTTRNRNAPGRENGTSQRMTTARALPAVPGATGRVAGTEAGCDDERYAVERRGAARRARRPARIPRPRRCGFARTFPVVQAAISQIDDAVDLRRLPGRPAFPGERRILARAVDQDVGDRAGEGRAALPGPAVLMLLHERGALGRGPRAPPGRDTRTDGVPSSGE